jgi:hypothetical protein
MRFEVFTLLKIWREEATGGYGKLRNEEFHNLYSIPGIFRIINSRRLTQAGKATCLGNMRNA